MGSSASRRLRRLAAKKTTRRQQKATIQGQEFNLNEMPAEAAAMASFRESAEYQQLVAEILQHATTAAENLAEDSEHFEYFTETVEALEEHYADVKRYVSERGVELLTAMDCTKEPSLIEVPELVVE